MKNIFRKNHIIITALLIMIVIAGYLSFTNQDTPEDPDSLATINPDTGTYDGLAEMDGLEVVTDTTDDETDDTDTTDDDTTDDDTDVTDDDDTDTTDDETADDTDTEDANEDDDPADEDASDELGMNDISDEDILATAQDVTDNGEIDIEDGVPGEAVLASTGIDASYFISSKIQREQVRAKNRDILMGMIESPDVTDEAKKDAMDSMIRLTEISEMESAAEILLGAKGFDGAMVYIVGDEVSVMVNAPNLTKQQLAIVEDIVKGETDIPVDKIHINPVVVEE
jgi:stage III sporulation protein AH